MENIFQPLEALDAKFEEQMAAQQLKHPAHFDGAAVLEEQLSSKESVEAGHVAKIPLVQTMEQNWALLPNTLVRFVGMVQDMLEPEYFCSAVRLKHRATGAERVVSGKYRDMSSSPYLDYDIDAEIEQSLASRHLLYCVPVPAESEWAINARAAVDMFGRPSKQEEPVPATRSGDAESPVKVNEAAGVGGGAVQTTDSGHRVGRKRCASRRTSSSSTEQPLDEAGDLSEEEDREALNSPKKTASDDLPPPSRIRTEQRPHPHVCTASPSSSSASTSSSLPAPAGVSANELNLPIPTETRQPCLLKLYDYPEGIFKLNDVVEVVGILSRPHGTGIQFLQSRDEALAADPALAAENLVNPLGAMLDHEEPGFGDQARKLDSHRVPRIHSMFVRKLEHPHVHPLTEPYNQPLFQRAGNPSLSTASLVPARVLHEAHGMPVANSAHKAELGTSKAAQLPEQPVPRPLRSQAGERALVLSWLSRHTGADSLAAEFLLLRCLARPYKRVGEIRLGHVTFNLTGCSSSQASTVVSGLRAILPRVAYITLTCQELNSRRFRPVKDYVSNCLRPGALQLSAGTHVVADETLLDTGKLNSAGVQNVRALQTLADSQEVEYDFSYHKSNFPVDLPVLVLSTRPSIVKNCCTVPLEVQSAPTSAPQASPEQLGRMRLYIAQSTAMGSAGSVNMSAEVASAAQEYFLTRRKDCAERQRKLAQGADQACSKVMLPPTFGASDFHRLLDLARWVAVSFGESEVSIASWEHSVKLDEARAARLASPVG